MIKKIFLWSDKWWDTLREVLVEYIKENWYELEDLWIAWDYPDIAKDVCEKVTKNDWIWILLCGTWIWMSISANKVKWIRAALVHNWYEAGMAKNHNNANVLCMWWRVIWPEIAKLCLDKYLNTEFEWWRHERRINKFE